MTDENESARKAAIARYGNLVVAHGIVGGGMIACGYLASQVSKKEEEDDRITFGSPPYYLGGFIVGPVELLSALLSMSIWRKGSESGSTTGSKKSEVACMMTIHFILSFFKFPLCFMGCIFAGLFGNDDEDEDPLRYGIIAGCAIALIVSVYVGYVYNTAGTHFGIVSHRQRHVIVAAGGYANAGDPNAALQLEQMRNQNLTLQQHLQLQQQQQQPQPLGGQYPSAPPPAYSSAENPAYPPSSAFPPAYGPFGAQK